MSVAFWSTVPTEEVEMSPLKQPSRAPLDPVPVLNFRLNPIHHFHLNALSPLHLNPTVAQSNADALLPPVINAQQTSDLATYSSVPSDTTLSRSRQLTPSTNISMSPGITSIQAAVFETRDTLTHSAALTAETLINGSVDGTPLSVVGPNDESTFGPLGWPLYVPPPELLHHLAETFFDSMPHAPRLIHRQSFMSSLAAPPLSKQFPSPGEAKSSAPILPFLPLGNHDVDM
ncbi:hypothetical protein FRB93_008814 [Tulasnella sp. JGI-2019a]|nr:hypothetical protein FRB93_008814 [Tulasnella sp. JGI-2019a]